MAVTKDILNAIKTDFLKINGTGDYTTNLKKCHSVFRYLKDLRADEFDSFYVEGLQAKAETGESLIKWTWGIGVYFYLSAAEDIGKSGLIRDKVEDLKADIVTLIKTPLVTEALDEVISVELSMFDPYIDFADNKAVFGLLLTVEYVD